MFTNKGILSIKLNCKNGKTYIEHCYTESFLKIAKAFYLDDSGEAFIYIMNPTGGIGQGDYYDININLASNSEAFITSQSATKIYKMGEKGSFFKERIYLDKDSLLEYFPDPSIPFAESKFKAEAEIFVSKGATLLIGEMLFPGRYKRKERFLFDYFVKKTKIFYNGQLIFYDHMSLRPKEIGLDNSCLFEKYSFYGQLICLSEKIDRNLTDKIHFLLKDLDHTKASSSLFHQSGLVVRIIGQNNLCIHTAIQKSWSMLRKSLLNRPEILLRKY